jgi:hypothetical protein
VRPGNALELQGISADELVRRVAAASAHPEHVASAKQLERWLVPRTVRGTPRAVLVPTAKAIQLAGFH